MFPRGTNVKNTVTFLSVASSSIDIISTSCVACLGAFMHGSLQGRVDHARKIERRIRQGTDKIVSAGKFAVVAKALWPLNTAAHIASIAGKDERTGARWLSGEFEPPNIVLTAILIEITKRE